MGLEFFIVALIVVGLITLIGHGIWVLLATIFRAYFDGKTEQESLNRYCWSCGASVKLGHNYCAFCGRSQEGRVDDLGVGDMAVALRMLDHLFKFGRIDAAVYRSVIQGIEEERGRIGATGRRDGAVSSETVKSPLKVDEALPAGEIVRPSTSSPATPRDKRKSAVEPIVAERLEEPAGRPAVSSRVEAIIQNDAAGGEADLPAAVDHHQPRRSFSEVLSTFMEERSIRWGEIAGGLLVLGCSIALVISLWSQIADVPFFKVSIFMVITAGLFGLGFYSAYHWKLPTTSSGVLIISILLVPLNFLAITAFSSLALPLSGRVFAGELIGLVLFLILVYQASRVIVPDCEWMMICVVLGPSFAMLMTRHWGEISAATPRWLLLGAAPIAFYWLGIGWLLRRLGRKDVIGEPESRSALVLLAVALFATLLPFGLLLVGSGRFAYALRQHSMLLSLLGVPVIASGLSIWKRACGRQSDQTLLADQTPLADQTSSAGQTLMVATSISLVGSLISLAALLAAWPDPISVMRAALINCAICAIVAWRYELRLAHIFGILHLVLSYLVGVNLAVGRITLLEENGMRVVVSFGSVESGTALVIIFLLFAAGSELLRRAGRSGPTANDHIYFLAAVATGVISLAAVSVHGFGREGDPHHLVFIYLFYSIAAVIFAWRRDLVIGSWAGIGLASLAILQALAFKFVYALSPYHPVRLSALICASVAAVAATFLKDRGARVERLFVSPLTVASLICSFAVLPFIAFGGWMAMADISLRLLWLSAIWLVLACVNCWPRLFTGFQVVLTLSVVCGVADMVDDHPALSPRGFIDPLMVRAQGIALTLLGLAWGLLRLGLRRLGVTAETAQPEYMEEAPPEGSRASRKFFNAVVAARLLYPSSPRFDRIVIVIPILIFALLSASGFLGIGLVEKPGAGSILFGLLLIVLLVAGLWERFERRAILAMMIVMACFWLLVAGRRENNLDAASVHRWLSAVSFAIVSLPILFRGRISLWCERLGWPEFKARSEGLATPARILSAILFAGPTLLLTLYSFGFAALTSQDGGYIFSHRVWAKVSLILPLIVISFSSIAHAVRERSAGYACSSGLILNLAVTLGSMYGEHGPYDGVLLWLVKLNIVTTCLFSIAWLVALHFGSRREEGSKGDRALSLPLKIQIYIVLCLSLSLLALADARIFIGPASRSSLVLSLGTVSGWLAVLLPVIALNMVRRESLLQRNIASIGIGLIATVSLIACTLSRWDDGDWMAFHALMIGAVIIAWMLLAAYWIGSVWPSVGVRDTVASIWSASLGSAAILMILRGILEPGETWWTISTPLAVGLLFGHLAVLTGRRSYLYVSAALCNLIAIRLLTWASPGGNSGFDFLNANIVGIALPGLIWLILEVKSLGPRRTGRSAIEIFAPHRMAALLSLGLMAASCLGQFFVRLLSANASAGHTLLGWLALVSVAALVIACLWDEKAGFARQGLWVVGLLVIVKVVDARDYAAEEAGVVIAAATALYTLGVSALWYKREALAKLADRAGIPRRAGEAGRAPDWILAGNALITIVVTALASLTLVFVDPLPERLVATTASLILPPATALLAYGERRRRLMRTSIRLLLLGMVLWSWAWFLNIGAGFDHLITMVAVAELSVIVYRLWSIGLFSFATEWRDALRAEVPWITVSGLSALALLISIEAAGMIMPQPAAVAVIAILISLIVVSLAFALLPREDPFGFSVEGREHKRMRYVYGAEAFMALTLVHARITMPQLFGGRFRPYWPLIVMMVAFLGVGLSHLFRRRGRIILAEPLERTGVILPLLPVIGFWVANSAVSYSSLLFLVGLFYGVMSIAHRSLFFGLLAVVSGNGGLWYLLSGMDGYAIFEHPQLYLIPTALSVLAAARLNRDRLSQEQITAIRYAALITIYASSTTDIFINGVSNSPWLSIVLAALSVTGVIVGLILRVRAFLFLGTTFLLLAMLAMIWTASVNLGWGWLWYVTGIVFGILIIYAFAMFEKKRNEVLSLVAHLKRWQA